MPEGVTPEAITLLLGWPADGEGLAPSIAFAAHAGSCEGKGCGRQI